MDCDQFWQQCLKQLETELSFDDVNNWLLPLQPTIKNKQLQLLAPNRYVFNHVKRELGDAVQRVVLNLDPSLSLAPLEMGFFEGVSHSVQNELPDNIPADRKSLDPLLIFETHVEGNSNRIARAAASQVGTNPGGSFNPLFIYGGVGLGKTHLMQAAGHQILDTNPCAKVRYIRSEIFVADMVKALKTNSMEQFKSLYRSLDALLIDDIQFFSGKNQTQEEFFHTFNQLLEGQKQIIITSDRIPQDIKGVEERLVSRFSSGLTVEIDKPELETRVAILETKSNTMGMELSNEVAFFVGNVITSNVRELEGALHRISAYAQFTHRPIDTDLARDALKDLLIYKDRNYTVDNIQRLVADYYNISISDLLSKKRTRTIARPRQIAMAFSKEFTQLSLPKIGAAFGGRDHTTVIHACKKVEELAACDAQFQSDHKKLLKIING